MCISYSHGLQHCCLWDSLQHTDWAKARMSSWCYCVSGVCFCFCVVFFPQVLACVLCYPFTMREEVHVCVHIVCG